MGMLFSWSSKEDMMRELKIKAEPPERLVCSEWVDDNYWAVVETILPDGTRQVQVLVAATECRDGWWGYKPFYETDGPAACNMPLAFLDLLTPPLNAWAAAWRNDVRRFHGLAALEPTRSAHPLDTPDFFAMLRESTSRYN